MTFAIGTNNLAARWLNRVTIIDRISNTSRWLPVVISVSISTATVFSWQALIIQERTQVEQMSQFQSSAVNNSSVVAQLGTRIKAPERMGKGWEAWGGMQGNG